LESCLETGLGSAWVRDEQLLDTYTSERVPIIESVIRTTDLLTHVMGTPNRFVAALRNAVIPMVSGLAPFQHAFVRRLSELGIGYRGSPIVDGPGERFLDESMLGRNGISSKFLLMTEAPSLNLIRIWSAPLKELVEARPFYGRGLNLVRPDGYVALSSDTVDYGVLTALGRLIA
jgi:hypothetical protein